MKKIAVFAFLFSITIAAFPQFMATGTGHSIQLTGSSITNVDAVFLFNGITADNQVQFTGTATSFTWQKYDGTFMSNQSWVAVENATGYILTADGKKYYIWVIDYQQYLATLSSLTPVEGSDKCSNLNLVFNGTIPELAYYDKSNVKQGLKRQFTLTYSDLQYVTDKWTDIDQTQKISTPITTISVSAPLKDTKFILSGDQYATQFGITSSISSGVYSAIRTQCHLTGSIIERDALNEAGRKIAALEGSGPLDVSLKSNANLPVTQFYEWKVYNLANPNTYLRYTDTDLRYVFHDEGTYKVLLTVTNTAGTCTSSDSVIVIVSKSFLQVPNVFTPNGDGKNDEFRVSYRSIATYKILLYSSWAGRVFISTDPGEGWDGRTGGKLAPPGVYYYLITATGTDGKKYKLKGNVNLLRGKNAK